MASMADRTTSCRQFGWRGGRGAKRGADGDLVDGPRIDGRCGRFCCRGEDPERGLRETPARVAPCTPSFAGLHRRPAPPPRKFFSEPCDEVVWWQHHF